MNGVWLVLRSPTHPIPRRPAMHSVKGCVFIFSFRFLCFLKSGSLWIKVSGWPPRWGWKEIGSEGMHPQRDLGPTYQESPRGPSTAQPLSNFISLLFIFSSSNPIIPLLYS
ncbi:hypothetical protein I3842_13G178000 [Carya illinoinensis]|uniref:Uncharacterized protein n=1 Tax=Carya illinoinensis TaxID=32201 RepID=A0A922IUB9_CARIL|nr:hypothetical protein I3842_13G178000 [Carya illinoinensis]